MQIDPDYAEAHNNLGSALLLTGRTAEAIDEYEQALRIDPDYAEAHNNLGNALVQTGRAPEAIDHYKEALRITPTSADAHNNLGAALAQMGRISEAIEQLKAALRINPSDIDARNNLTKLEALQKTTPAKNEMYVQAMGSSRLRCHVEQSETSLISSIVCATTTTGFTFSRTGAATRCTSELRIILRVGYGSIRTARWKVSRNATI